MTVAPVSGHTPLHHPRLDWAAVGTAVLAAVMLAVGMVTLGIVGFGADDEDFDNWKGVVVAVGLVGGILVGLAASVMALAAKLLHEHWAWLWFALLLAPVFVLAMPFWFE